MKSLQLHEAHDVFWCRPCLLNACLVLGSIEYSSISPYLPHNFGAKAAKDGVIAFDQALIEIEAEPVQRKVS
jgi:hypothetical protein